MRHGRASIRFRAARSPRSVGERRRRRGSRPSPAAAAASRPFWPFWRGRARHGTIIRFAHQQTPSDLQRVKTRPSLAILCGGLAPFFETRLTVAFPRSPSISSPRARAVCASPCGIAGPPRPFRVLVAPMVFRRSGAASSRERCPRAASPFQDSECAIDVVVSDKDLHWICTLS